MGRFISKDTFPHDPGSPQGPNRYVHVMNRASMLVDPTGLVAIIDPDDPENPDSYLNGDGPRLVPWGVDPVEDRRRATRAQLDRWCTPGTPEHEWNQEIQGLVTGSVGGGPRFAQVCGQLTAIAPGVWKSAEGLVKTLGSRVGPRLERALWERFNPPYELGQLPGMKMGSTFPDGRIVIDPAKDTIGEFLETLRHESFHHAIRPPWTPLANLSQGIYNTSNSLRMAEEVMAEWHATRSLRRGLQYGLSADVGDPLKAVAEVATGSFLGYSAYQGWQSFSR